MTERRVDDAVGEKESGDDERQSGVVEVRRLGYAEAWEQQLGDGLDAVLAPGHVAPLVHEVEEHLGEREGDHREVDPAPADREVPERRRERHRDDRAAEDGDGEWQLEGLGEQRGRVPAAAPEGRMAEREHAAVPEEEVHRDREERPGHDAEGQRRIEDAGEREGEDDADREEDQVRAFHAASCEPKRPAGRTRRMTAMRAKTMTFSIAGSKIAPTLARRPARKPAATAPGRGYGWPWIPNRRRIASWMKIVRPKVRRKLYSGSSA